MKAGNWKVDAYTNRTLPFNIFGEVFLDFEALFVEGFGTSITQDQVATILANLTIPIVIRLKHNSNGCCITRIILRKSAFVVLRQPPLRSECHHQRPAILRACPPIGSHHSYVSHFRPLTSALATATSPFLPLATSWGTLGRSYSFATRQQAQYCTQVYISHTMSNSSHIGSGFSNTSTLSFTRNQRLFTLFLLLSSFWATC